MMVEWNVILETLPLPKKLKIVFKKQNWEVFGKCKAVQGYLFPHPSLDR